MLKYLFCCLVMGLSHEIAVAKSRKNVRLKHRVHLVLVLGSKFTFKTGVPIDVYIALQRYRFMIN
jgi:hypothetical protein